MGKLQNVEKGKNLGVTFAFIICDRVCKKGGNK